MSLTPLSVCLTRFLQRSDLQSFAGNVTLTSSQASNLAYVLQGTLAAPYSGGLHIVNLVERHLCH